MADCFHLKSSATSHHISSELQCLVSCLIAVFIHVPITEFVTVTLANPLYVHVHKSSSIELTLLRTVARRAALFNGHHASTVLAYPSDVSVFTL